MLLSEFYKLLLGNATLFEIKPHHIRLRRLVQLATHIRPDLSNSLRSDMALLQQAPFTVRPFAKSLIDCHSGGRSDYTWLPQSTTNTLPHPTRMLDKFLAPHQDASNWSTQPF